MHSDFGGTAAVRPSKASQPNHFAACGIEILRKTPAPSADMAQHRAYLCGALRRVSSPHPRKLSSLNRTVVVSVSNALV